MAKARRKPTAESPETIPIRRAAPPRAPDAPREAIDERSRRRAGECPPTAAVGIECPSCGSCWHSVYRTSRFLRKIVRYRECERCGKRFMTTETHETPTDSTA